MELVSWSLTSPFSTNMAIDGTGAQQLAGRPISGWSYWQDLVRNTYSV